MTALEHLVLESVRRLDGADADQIRSKVTELSMGGQISEERVAKALESLLDRELVAPTESQSERFATSYRLTRGGELRFSAKAYLPGEK